MIDQSNDKLVKRAKRKLLNAPVMSHLIALDSPLKKAYWTTVHCSSKMHTHDGKVCSRYCKRTWCKVCSPIRTAVRLNNYRPGLEALGDLQLTTLTMPNVPAHQIKSSITHFRKVFRQYRDTYAKREGMVFRGVYNFECTYNHITSLYHPHIHIIHEAIPYFNKPRNSSLFFNDIVTYWLQKTPSANIAAQDTRICTDLIEGFKYQSLSVFKIKINGKRQPFIPVAELDQIYQQLQNVRCFQPFGIARISQDEEDKQIDQLEAYVTGKPDGIYIWNFHDWHLHNRQDITLSDYIPDRKTLDYYYKLENNEPYKTFVRPGQVLDQKTVW